MSRAMTNKILCVAEKPSIAKAVANHLANGPVTVVRKKEKIACIFSKRLTSFLEKYW